jgi:bifunctional enzyme CysN/CysC
VLRQTRRHLAIARLLGVRSFVLAVNKMDLIGFDRERFAAIAADFAAALDKAGGGEVAAIPLSALNGDNVASPSPATPWHAGPTLLAYLETVTPARAEAFPALRLPVQHVVRADGRRFYAGTLAGGALRVGEEIVVAPSGRRVAVRAIETPAGPREAAGTGDAVAVALAADVDCSRGDMIADPDDPPGSGDQFEATLIWMDEAALLPGRQYLLKLGTQTVPATVQEPKYRLDVETMAHLAAKTLALNDIGVANLWTARPILFEPYEKSRDLGGFILIDRISNATVAAGLIHFALRRSQNVHAQAIAVTPARRAALMGQRAKLLWFTGLSGAGKSTIANLVEAKLHALGRHSFLLDGDNVRRGLNRDLGFTDADRVENIRRVGETARLMMDAGLVVLAAFISPFRAEREMVRAMVPEGDFVEIFVDTPLAEAEKRDVKGLYRKARAGRLANFTGIDSPYEPPEAPELALDTLAMSADDAADAVIAWLERHGLSA